MSHQFGALTGHHAPIASPKAAALVMHRALKSLASGRRYDDGLEINALERVQDWLAAQAEEGRC